MISDSTAQGGNTAAHRNESTASRGDSIGRDVLAGLVAAVAAIPDGMASAVLAGVNPVHGLYCLMVGMPIGALTTSSVFMSVGTTSAMALVVGDTLSGTSAETLVPALITLVVLVGLFQLSLGLLKLGFLTRFISFAVMTGFLTGIGIIIILGQLGDFTGYSGSGPNKVAQTIDLLRNLDQIDPQTLIVGLVTLALIIVLERTRLGPVSMLVALVVASAMVIVLGWTSVTLVGDISPIPRSLPWPALPSLALVPGLLVPAVAVGLIGLVQAAGVSQGYPNPDGRFPDPSGDFRGQGLANLTAGFFQGIPVGGSVSGTALVVNAGARSRWANVICGVFVAVGVLLFSNQIEQLPMTALAAILIYAGYQTLKPARVRSVWNTSSVARAVMAITFVFTLYLPIQKAIFLGVALQVLLFVFRQAERLTLTELVAAPGGDFLERPASAVLPNHATTILLPTGSLFFAAASDFEEEVPAADQTEGATVILILRGRQELGSTFIEVLKRYAVALKRGGGRLLLADVSAPVREQLTRSGALDLIGAENVVPSEPTILGALRTALALAQEGSPDGRGG